MSEKHADDVKEGEDALIKGVKTHIFVDEPYGCKAIEFYKVVFGAIELKRVYENIETDDEIKGSVRVVSAELQLGSTSIVVSELIPNSSWRKDGYGGHPGPRGKMIVYMEDISFVLTLASQLGASMQSFFDTDHVLSHAEVSDPYGYTWYVHPVSMMSHSAATEEGSSSKHSPTPQDIPKEIDQL